MTQLNHSVNGFNRMANIFSLDRLLCRRYDNSVADEPRAEQPIDPTAAYLTLAQVSAALGVAISTVRIAVAEGRLPVVRVYGRVLVDPAAVEEYRARSQPEGKPKRGRPRKS